MTTAIVKMKSPSLKMTPLVLLLLPQQQEQLSQNMTARVLLPPHQVVLDVRPPDATSDTTGPTSLSEAPSSSQTFPATAKPKTKQPLASHLKFVEDKGFKKLCNALNPFYTPLCRRIHFLKCMRA